MSDSQKPINWPMDAGVAKLFTHDECQARYTALMQQALAMREALAKYKDLCVHWNVAHHETCGRPAEQALEQFDAFMKESK